MRQGWNLAMLPANLDSRGGNQLRLAGVLAALAWADGRGSWPGPQLIRAAAAGRILRPHRLDGHAGLLAVSEDPGEPLPLVRPGEDDPGQGEHLPIAQAKGAKMTDRKVSEQVGVDQYHYTSQQNGAAGTQGGYADKADGYQQRGVEPPRRLPCVSADFLARPEC